MSPRAPMDSREVDSRVVGWMERAVALAAGCRTHPNPRVGSLVLDADEVEVGSGIHRGPGTPHAETVALAQSGSSARRGTVVVTLEPCSHFGRTPPCVDAIIAAGIEKVYVGVLDPDPRVSGSGVSQLRAAGVDVTVGIASGQVHDLDPGYFVHRRLGRPRFLLKLAATLDGQTAADDGTSQWITCEEARRDGHVLRSQADAVMVGSGTIFSDDPQLNVRLSDYSGPQPRPVIIAGKTPIPADSCLLSRQPLVYGTSDTRVPDGVELVVVGPSARVDLALVAQDLGRRGIVDVLVEGGSALATSLAAADLLDEFVLYFGSKLALGVGQPMFDGVFAAIGDATDVHIENVRQIGRDVRIAFRPKKSVA